MLEELELTSDSQPYRPTTPIALELYGHFARGGSAAEGVRLVEALERHALAITSTSKLTAKRSVERGLRLSPDWQPSPPDISFALDRGLSPKRISTEAEKFRNYWVAKSGAGACKRDWAACWRNWIINSMEKWSNEQPNHRGGGLRTDSSPRHSRSGSDAIIAGMARVADRLNERRVTEVAPRRALPPSADVAERHDVKP
jgi:hypothetical protein